MRRHCIRTCPLANSYVTGASCEAGSAAELAASRKEEKYAAIDGRYIFEPIAIESLGVFSTSARQLLADLGRRISQISGEARESFWLRLSEMFGAGTTLQRHLVT